MGFTVAYAAVTWTAGDVITEAKMDNMVANDQAYDSHSAQGLEITEMSTPSTPAANKIRLYAKDNGGVSDLYFLRDDGTEGAISYPAKTETQTNKTLTSPVINTGILTAPTFFGHFCLSLVDSYY